MKGLEPSHLAAPDPKSGVSTNFTTSAHVVSLTIYQISVILISLQIFAKALVPQRLAKKNGLCSFFV
jgi:hypothetical protein